MWPMLELCALFTLNPAPPGPAPSAAPLVQVNDDQSARINLQGRVVNVEVQIYRDFTPTLDGSGGDLRLEVHLSTLDNRGLPLIRSINSQVTNAHSIWRTALTSFAFDARSGFLGAEGGPRWRVATQVGVRIEMLVGNRTYVATIPATIDAVY
jgi:hypothetical protein